MTRAAWDTLLAEARRLHESHPALADFCPFPDDVTPQDVAPHNINAARLFEADEQLDRSHPMAAAFHGASPIAQWRETYKGTQIASDFMDRFGCYCLVGSGGAFTSAQFSSYVVYMPSHLEYPAHHHPAEELYVILAGSAEFHCAGKAPETLGPGDVSQHASNQPHATITRDQPVLAYVVWRNNLGIKPVWTQEALR